MRSSERSTGCAVVLAGGGSRRMGADKRFVVLDGREALERALGTATAGFRRLVLSTGRDAACERALRRYGWTPAGGAAAGTAPAPGGPRGDQDGGAVHRRRGRTLRAVGDRRPDAGPLAGIEAALPHGGAMAWVLACDYPLATPALGRRLLAALAASGGDAVVPVVAGRRQPLCAAYAPAAAPAAARCLDEGIRAVGAWLDLLRVEELDEDGLCGLGDPASLFLNLNRPPDLEAARRLLRSRAGSRGRPAGRASRSPG